MPLYLIKDKLYRKGEQAVNAGNVEKDPAAGENFVNNVKEPFARREELCYDKGAYPDECGARRRCGRKGAASL